MDEKVRRLVLHLVDVVAAVGKVVGAVAIAQVSRLDEDDPMRIEIESRLEDMIEELNVRL